jgi:hypothetical protein
VSGSTSGKYLESRTSNNVTSVTSSEQVSPRIVVLLYSVKHDLVVFNYQVDKLVGTATKIDTLASTEYTVSGGHQYTNTVTLYSKGVNTILSSASAESASPGEAESRPPEFLPFSFTHGTFSQTTTDSISTLHRLDASFPLGYSADNGKILAVKHGNYLGSDSVDLTILKVNGNTVSLETALSIPVTGFDYGALGLNPVTLTT